MKGAWTLGDAKTSSYPSGVRAAAGFIIAHSSCEEAVLLMRCAGLRIPCVTSGHLRSL